MKGNFEKMINGDTPVFILWYDSVDLDLDFDNNKDEVYSLLDSLKETMTDKVRVYKIPINNVTNSHFIEEYKIRKTPSYSLFHNGEQVLHEKQIDMNSIIDNILDLYSKTKENCGNCDGWSRFYPTQNKESVTGRCKFDSNC